MILSHRDPSRRYVLLAPCELANFADKVAEDEDEDREEEPETTLPLAGFVARLGAYLDRLPQGEREAIALCFLQERNQRDAAQILGIKQQSVQYRLQRGLERLRFWVQQPAWSSAEVQRIAGTVLSGTELRVAVSFWRTTSCAATAEELELNYGWTRTRLGCAIRKLREGQGEAVALAQALHEIRDGGLMGTTRRKDA